MQEGSRLLSTGRPERQQTRELIDLNLIAAGSDLLLGADLEGSTWRVCNDKCRPIGRTGPDRTGPRAVAGRRRPLVATRDQSPASRNRLPSRVRWLMSARVFAVRCAFLR